jgi:hypothetical protein
VKWWAVLFLYDLLSSSNFLDLELSGVSETVVEPGGVKGSIGSCKSRLNFGDSSFIPQRSGLLLWALCIILGKELDFRIELRKFLSRFPVDLFKVLVGVSGGNIFIIDEAGEAWAGDDGRDGRQYA